MTMHAIKRTAAEAYDFIAKGAMLLACYLLMDLHGEFNATKAKVQDHETQLARQDARIDGIDTRLIRLETNSNR